MRLRRCTVLNRLVCLAAVAGLPAVALAAGPGISFHPEANSPGSTPIRDLPGGRDDCTLVDFEGVGDNNPVGTFSGTVTVAFGASWFGLVDSDNGGNGNFANEPSPVTVAYYNDQDDISISVSPSVRYVEFWYSAAAWSLPVIVTAYDADGNLIDQAEGSTIGAVYDGADCVGDPTGDFCLWDRISLVAPSDDIASIEITGTVSNYFAIDDLLVCVTPPVPIRNRSWGAVKSLYR